MNSRVKIIRLQLTSVRNTRRVGIKRKQTPSADRSLLRRLRGRRIAHHTVNALEIKRLNLEEMKVLRTLTLWIIHWMVPSSSPSRMGLPQGLTIRVRRQRQQIHTKPESRFLLGAKWELLTQITRTLTPSVSTRMEPPAPRWIATTNIICRWRIWTLNWIME